MLSFLKPVYTKLLIFLSCKQCKRNMIAINNFFPIIIQAYGASLKFSSVLYHLTSSGLYIYIYINIHIYTYIYVCVCVFKIHILNTYLNMCI